jgi:hypothetical protein
MALRRQVIDFIRLCFLDYADQVGCIRKVTIMQGQAWISDVWILIYIVDPSGIKR